MDARLDSGDRTSKNRIDSPPRGKGMLGMHYSTLTRNLSITMMVLVTGFLVGCPKEEKPDPVQGPEEQAEFTPGETEMSEPVTVDDYGAVLQGPEGSPIEDVVVNIPVGALHETTDIQLGYNDGSVSAVAGEPGGVVLDVDAGGVEQFNVPIEVSFSYAAAGTKAALDYVPVPYHIATDGSMHLVTLTELDPIEGTATFETFHASWFTWILELLGFGSDSSDSFDTGFRPDDDGFQITNFGSAYNPGGECFGMSAWALWYFSNHSAASGDFYPRFMDTIGTSGLTGQDIIATRAHSSIHAQISHYYSSIISTERGLTPLEQADSILNALRNTAAPVILGLGDSSSTRHAVLTYGFESDFDDTDSEIKFNVYDPNSPGNEREITFDAESDSSGSDGGDWNQYGSYTVAHYLGDGSLSLTESYDSILEDAEADFHSDNDAIITVTSHANGDEIGERSTTLTGTIDDGEVNITELTIFVEGVPFVVAIGEDDRFAQEIPIGRGPNEITFQTRGIDHHGNPVLANNNMTSEKFELIGVTEQAAILVTLTWDKDDTDVDLYVIDPTGDYSCYYNMVTDDGGVLDVDDVNGYGPEHWTLTYEDTVRWGQDYTVRLHYYSDHGNGPTNYTVTILLDEGTGWQTIETFTGTLAACDPLNDAPGDTGADWADIAVVRPTNDASKRGDIFFPYPGASYVINTPVPTPEGRMLFK